MPVAFTGKYRHLLANTGKLNLPYWNYKQNPTLNIYIWLISIIEVRDTNNIGIFMLHDE